MHRLARCAPTLAVLLVLAFDAPVAQATDVGAPVSDPAGDCTAAPCADLLAVTAGLAPNGAVTFRFTGVREWYDFGNPPTVPLPQVWIWTTSPDTAPPDATVKQGTARIVGGDPIGYTVAYNDLTHGGDSFGATTVVEAVIGQPEHGALGFLKEIGVPFRWRATLPADSSAVWDPSRPIDPHTVDVAPATGSVAYSLPDTDSDRVPDPVDPCPTQAFTGVAPGWSAEKHLDGCPAPVAPFSAQAFRSAAKNASRSLRVRWRSSKRRAAAIRTRRLNLKLRLPAGRGRVSVEVNLLHPHGPTQASVFGRRTCTGGGCLISLKVVPKGVRAYRHKALAVTIRFSTGTGRSALTTDFRTKLRMPV